MFIRIVKMSFDEKHIETFLENFHQNKTKTEKHKATIILTFCVATQLRP